MAHKASDGKMFPSLTQVSKYEASLSDKGKEETTDAPSDSMHQMVRQHGLAMDVHVVREGNGRTRVTAKHQDGFVHKSVHPETYRALDVGKELMGIEPPPAVQTLGKSRSHPTGPKEEDRVKREDNRAPEEEDES